MLFSYLLMLDTGRLRKDLSSHGAEVCEAAGLAKDFLVLMAVK